MLLLHNDNFIFWFWKILFLWKIIVHYPFRFYSEKMPLEIKIMIIKYISSIWYPYLYRNEKLIYNSFFQTQRIFSWRYYALFRIPSTDLQQNFCTTTWLYNFVMINHQHRIQNLGLNSANGLLIEWAIAVSFTTNLSSRAWILQDVIVDNG